MTETEPRRRVLMTAGVLIGVVMLSAAAILGLGELGGASLSPVSLPDGGERRAEPARAGATRVTTASAPVTRPGHHAPTPAAVPSPLPTATARPTATRSPRTVGATPAPRRGATTAPPVRPGEASVTPARSRRPGVASPAPAGPVTPTPTDVVPNAPANPAGHTPPGHSRHPGHGNGNGNDNGNGNGLGDGDAAD
ncbi:hypothetical protein [Nonomuraea sp. NPDC005501]|uniref:hypothetical protein n=1 Tax=Nonomuraea sp. NPDC005501 TaxID=3156884 RepID=UPI0033BC0833